MGRTKRTGTPRNGFGLSGSFDRDEAWLADFERASMTASIPQSCAGWMMAGAGMRGVLIHVPIFIWLKH